MSVEVGGRLRIGVLGSGKGSNFRAIADAIDGGTLAAEVRVVISDVASAGILSLARERGLRAEFVEPGRFRTKLEPEAERRVVEILQSAGAEWVVLAGYMRMIKPPLLEAFPGRIINIHPSLLPRFRGSMHGSRRSPRACPRRAALSISWMQEWTPGRSSPSAPCRCWPTTRRRRCTRAFRSPSIRFTRRCSAGSGRRHRRVRSFKN